ncbi:MAG TPA: adenylate/guanylate cyclase domain-containing protein, partial [Chloroflexia bacterium]|nr:adenylate/guanylate cyclase domain-containing protein [Chloroflexia bacterium]
RDMAEAVYQYEGYIDKFVGEAVMVVFGAPVAHEDDADRALRTALAMRERLAEFNRRRADALGGALSLHVGINTGTVVAGNVGSDLRMAYTVMGDTVNTASRLQHVAQPGQILVSRDTYRLTQEAFTFAALEPITVKGKRAPLTVFELQRARLHPGKSRGLKDLGAAFVGRSAELAQLRAVRDALEGGGGRIVTMTGEAGLGKSRLMAEWRSELGDGVRWLEGRAFAHTTGLAYGPFLDLIRRYAGIKDDDSEAEARTRLNAVLAGLFPADVDAPAIFANLLAMHLAEGDAAIIAALPGEALRRRLFTLLEELFARLASERPLWLVIEDMHWADLASVELIEYLLPLTQRLPLAVVGVFRLHPDETPRIFQILAEASYPDRYTHIALTALAEAASLAMVQQLLAMPDLPDSLGAMITAKAEGNPFFVEEVLRSLIERGALVRAESGEGWETTPLIEVVRVPDTLQGLLMSRLDRLPDETKWVVQQAAVIGRVFLYRVLLHMAEQNSGLEADLSHLEREELIRERARHPEVEYIFNHALTQEVAYGSLLAGRRRDLHRRAGEALQALFAERLAEFQSIVATHFFRGEAWEPAAEYLIRAGDAATRLFAHAEARLHYTQALEALDHLPDTPANGARRVDVTTNLVSVSVVADDPAHNIARLTAVEPLARALPGPDGTLGGDTLRLARVHYWLGRSHFYRNESREAIGYYRQVMAEAREAG